MQVGRRIVETNFIVIIQKWKKKSKILFDYWALS